MHSRRSRQISCGDGRTRRCHPDNIPPRLHSSKRVSEGGVLQQAGRHSDSRRSGRDTATKTAVFRSLTSSPAWNRTFSKSMMSPLPMEEMRSSTTVPIQSSILITFLFMSEFKRETRKKVTRSQGTTRTNNDGSAGGFEGRKTTAQCTLKPSWPFGRLWHSTS